VTPPSLCVIGDALLDIDWDGAVDRVCRDAPALVLDTPSERARPGGAALAATLAAASGARVALVTALSGDADGRRLVGLLADAGVDVVDLGLDAPTPVKLRLRSCGQAIARVDKACSPLVPPGPWTAGADAAVRAADAVVVSDYGRRVAALPEVAGAVASSRVRTVWDPHSSGPCPPASIALATPNLAEAHDLAGRGGAPPERVPELIALAARVTTVLGCPTAVTAGSLGAVVADGRSIPTLVPTTPCHGDACGAGDRFAVSAALALGAGATMLDAVERAVADARAFVARGDREAPEPRRAATVPAPAGEVIALRGLRGSTEAVAAASDVRRSGGVVVAAGGCFDVLHAGHVRLLDQARRMGDHLVVCLNSDRSVRRLKGAGRPLNAVSDRAAILRSLACVDGVVFFDEDTPSRALDAIRPHLFVKGADYQGVDLEEREVLSRWGGQLVLVPLVAGRSTSGLIASAVGASG
jgi:D-beta-D-heptose 7-phosphate kinase / D-beta-D-heptose 1-phosphate adenosyltransferase